MEFRILNLKHYNYYSILFISLLALTAASAYNEDEIDLILTKTQKERLDKFKRLMAPHLTQEYMNEDIYLVKWLKVNDFDIPRSSRMLNDNLAWRNENKMDTILNEDWSDLNDEYKFVIEGCDYEGRPTAIAYIGDWDLRKLVLAGKGRRLMRYTDKLYEESNQILRNMQARGSNATRANLLLEVSSFNVQQHLCPGCIPIISHLVTTLHRHFPLTVNFLIIVNTPQVALPIWEIIKPLMPKKSQEFVFIYGPNQKDWHAKLLEKHRIDPTRLSRAMGGGGPDGLDFQTITDNNYYFQCPSV